MDENYTKVHKNFLQACLHHTTLSIKQAIAILAPIHNKYGVTNETENEASVRKIVKEINAKLTEHDIEQRLDFVHFEWDDVIGDFLVFCNSFASVGPSPAYNEAECLYMKNVLEKIVLSDTHSISIMTAVHLTSASSSSSSSSSSQPSQSQSTMKKITKQRAEDLLDEWSSVGYFMMTGDILTLGPRAIGEYRDTFRTKFNDYIQSCMLCNEITLQPNHCPNDECEIALDKQCFNSYVLKKKKCPSCKSNWEEELDMTE